MMWFLWNIFTSKICLFEFNTEKKYFFSILLGWGLIEDELLLLLLWLLLLLGLDLDFWDLLVEDWIDVSNIGVILEHGGWDIKCVEEIFPIVREGIEEGAKEDHGSPFNDS